jgi:antitoxin (DNA-binding transcriptional repressor) of toxin-antitoxin stability system
MSKTVAAAEFQEHPLELLEEAAENQEELLILKDGKPLGTFVPIEPERPMTLEEFRLKYPVKILGDITEPMDDEWDCMT